MMKPREKLAVLLLTALCAASLGEAVGDKGHAVIWAEIHVVDASTGQGIPLVELETVNHLRVVTDNAGRVAFYEPGLMERELYFSIRSHGYEAKKDGFGFAGARLILRPGQRSEIKLTRRNLAERLCRLTGEGLYRDSVLLGYKPPRASPLNPGLVAGQDSVQAVVYRGEVYWFWGDTNRMSYPLGLFRTAGARTPSSFDKGVEVGIDFNYFVDKTGFARALMPLPERPQGVIWMDGVCTVRDKNGVEKLVGHYSRRKGLAAELEHGLTVFNDDKAIFEPLKQLPLEEKWRFPHGHPIAVKEAGKHWLYFGKPCLNVRVPATFEDLVDSKRYETFTCASASVGGKPIDPELDRDGRPAWRWLRDGVPVDSGAEHRWAKAGKIKPRDARFCPADAAAPAERIALHSGTIRWNNHRQRWVLIAGQLGGKNSLLGEVWYAESREPTGPFNTAVKIVTHDRQTFYNVCHHAFLDAADGRHIHFEGTYTNDFSGNPVRTPRYNYNQVLYRLDLKAIALRPARVP